MHIKNLTDKLEVVLITLAVWYIASYLINASYLVPYPHKVCAELATNKFLYIEAIAYTALEALGGLAIATFLALLLVMIMYFVPPTEKYIMPYAIGIKSTPIIAVAPLLIVWFGPGYSSKIIMAALISFFPILQGVSDALKSVPSEVLHYMKVLGTTRRRELILVRSFFAMPPLASSMKIAAPLSVVGAIVSEFLGADKGLGHILFKSITGARTTVIFSAVVCVVLIGWFFHTCTATSEKWLLRHLRMEREDYKRPA
jgi:NitT/TauT family transport system permease protein